MSNRKRSVIVVTVLAVLVLVLAANLGLTRKSSFSADFERMTNALSMNAKPSTTSLDIVNESNVESTFRSKEILNVKDFGATGDGVTDDTAAIQRVIDHLNSKGGGTLYLPKGQFKVVQLILYSNIMVRGEGNNSVLISDPNNRSYREGVLVTEDWVNPGHPTTNCVITSVTIDGGTRAVYGVFAQNARYIKVMDCQIINCRNGGIRFNKSTSNCTALRNHIVLPIDEPFGKYNNLQGIICVSETVDVYSGGKNDTLTFAEPTNKSTDHLIESNTILNGTHGIALFGAERCRINSNYVERQSHRGIILSPACKENQVIKNTIKDCKSTGIHLAWGSVSNSIEGNYIETKYSNIEGNGIKLYYGSKNNSIIANYVRGTKHAGIRITMGSPGNSVMNNEIIECGTGVEVESYINNHSDYYNPNVYQPANPEKIENVAVIGNTISNCKNGLVIAQRGGIDLKKCSFKDNKISYSSSFAVRVIEEYNNKLSLLNMTGNSVESVISGKAYILPRNTRHFEIFQGNQGLDVIN